MDQQVPEPVQASVESTGVVAVDEVLQHVSRLADRPVAEHVEVFERAHEQLRRALDAQPEVRPDNDQGA
jgi:hypothetical protein